LAAGYGHVALEALARRKPRTRFVADFVGQGVFLRGLQGAATVRGNAGTCERSAAARPLACDACAATTTAQLRVVTLFHLLEFHDGQRQADHQQSENDDAKEKQACGTHCFLPSNTASLK
jgi:hypothetical protein